MTPEQRAAVIAEALSWQGTPYHTNAAIKGAGADCALMPLAVYVKALGLQAPPPPKYVMQWHLHRGEELYLNYVRALPGVREIAAPGPADFALFRLGRVYSHGAIVLEAWPKILHAVNPRGVLQADATLAEKLRRTGITQPLFFTFV